MTGKVKKWFPVKGYGFIAPDDPPGPDIFAHVTGLKNRNRDERLMFEETRVQFDVTEGKKGLQAVGIVVLE